MVGNGGIGILDRRDRERFLSDLGRRSGRFHVIGIWGTRIMLLRKKSLSHLPKHKREELGLHKLPAEAP
jgi:hypothetical protein